MAQTTPPSMTPAPAQTPQRNDRTTFSTRVDAFVTWISNSIAEFSALATNVYNNAVDAFNSATSAATSATSAANSANAAATTANASLWVSGTTYTAYTSNVISPLNGKTYRRLITGAGATDPSLDSVNWVSLVGETPALKLLATLSPIAAANVDFLSTFSNAYDSYLIIGTNLNSNSGTTDILQMRLASGGVVDAGSNYGKSVALNTPFTATAAQVNITGNVLASGKGCNFVLWVKNANSSSGLKSMSVQSEWQQAATPSWNVDAFGAVYFAANILSGIRFLWNGGSNFAAQGSIKVFGVVN